MQPSVWTGIFVDLPLHETIERLADIGWKAVEISDEHLDMIMNSAAPDEAIAKAKAAAARRGVATPQAHAHLSANVTHEDKAKRKAEADWVVRHFEIAAKLGASNVVIHPGPGCGVVGRGDAKRSLEANAEAFKRLSGKAGELGLNIGVENLFDTKSNPGARRFGSEPGELLDLIELAGAPNLGITFDSSHANVQRLDIPGAVKAFGKLLICTHISDNDGSGDQHKVPGTGLIDWAALVEAFREIGYQGIFNLEVPGERHPDKALQELKVKHCLRVCENLCAR